MLTFIFLTFYINSIFYLGKMTYYSRFQTQECEMMSTDPDYLFGPSNLVYYILGDQQVSLFEEIINKYIISVNKIYAYSRQKLLSYKNSFYQLHIIFHI